MANRRDFIKTTVSGSVVLFSMSCKTLKTNQDLPNILILGDSISIGYLPFVKESLAGIAMVTRPYKTDGKPENCEGTTNGVANIDRWLGDTKWDVIHFNFGLHDIKHVSKESGKNSNDPNDPLQASPEKYEENLRFIVSKLKETKARLIYATTTPYPDAGLKPLRDPGMYKVYNVRAKKVMQENNIPINDLERFVSPQMESIMRPQNVHFTEEGSKVLAREVVKHLKEIIADF